MPREDLALKKDNNILSYIIMEQVKISDELSSNIEDLNFLLLTFFGDNYQYNNDDEPILRILFKRCEEEDFIQDFYDYILTQVSPKESNIITQTLVELLVVLRKIKKNFDWHDIHAEQFGYGVDGELVAFDLDNSIHLAPDGHKNYIRETHLYTNFKSFLNKNN